MKSLTSLHALPLLALCAANVSADFKSLNDAEMSELRGQGGLTIELETALSIGQVSYKDEGYLNINNLTLTDTDGSALDNITLTFDLAGENEILARGFSDYAKYASAGLLDSSNADIADALSKYTVLDGSGGVEGYGERFNSGDMVLHIGPTSPNLDLSAAGDTSKQASNLNALNSSIDFKLAIESIELTDSTNTQSTTMLSDISMEGLLGPVDLIFRNNGDLQNTTLPNGTSISDSSLEIDAHFKITDLDFSWDVADVIILFNLAAVGIENMRIHNERGADTLGHFGFASATAKLASATTASGQEGLAIYDVEFRADLDMPSVAIGGQSIGEVYFTDFVVSNTSIVVYGH